MTYLLTAIVAIIDPVLYQVEVHLCRDDAAVVGSHLDGHPFQEALNELFLLLDEVFQRVDKFYLFISLEDVHGF